MVSTQIIQLIDLLLESLKQIYVDAGITLQIRRAKADTKSDQNPDKCFILLFKLLASPFHKQYGCDCSLLMLQS